MNQLSPLRYPGGKSRVASYIRLVIESNGLTGDYVEPYAGGAGVALSLLINDVVSKIHINDIDRGIYTFWTFVLGQPTDLCRRIYDAKLDVEEWMRQRAIQHSSDPEPIDLAFSTFYLNRTNRSGIIQRGGVIGGLNQDGKWKIDARFNRLGLIKRIETIAAQASRVRVTQLDAVEFLDLFSRRSSTIALAYLDPPYYVKGKRLYPNFYEHSDHVAISERVFGLRFPWVVSYDNVEPIRQMYRERQRCDYGLRYSARERYEGQEVMFFSDCLEIPVGASPSPTPRVRPKAQVAEAVRSRE